MSVGGHPKHAFAYEGGDVLLVDEHTIVTKCGNLLKFSSVVSNSQHFLPRTKATNIVAFDCNAKAGEIALSACEENAEIDIYTLPEKKWKGRLANDTTAFEYYLLKFSRCGTRLLSLGTDTSNQLRVWDLERFEPIKGCLVSLPHRYSFASFNPLNADQFVVGGEHGITFWRVCKGHTSYCLTRIDATQVYDMAAITLGDVPTTGSLDEMAEKRRQYTSHCWSKEGYVYATNRLGEVVKFDPSRGTILALVSLSQYVVVTSILLTSECLIAAFSDGYLRWIHEVDFSVLQTASVPQGEMINAIGISPSFSRLVVGTSNGSLYELKAAIEPEEDEKSTQSGSLLTKLGNYHTGAILCMTLLIPAGGTNNDAIIISGGISSTLYLWTVTSCRGISTLNLQEMFESSRGQSGGITSMASRYLDPIILVGDTLGRLRIIYLAKAQGTSIDATPLHNVRVCKTSIDLLEIHPSLPLALVASSFGSVVYVISLEPEKQFRIVGFTKLPSAVFMTKWIPTSTLETTAFLCSSSTEMYYCAISGMEERCAVEWQLAKLGTYLASTVVHGGVFLATTTAKLLAYINRSSKALSILKICDAPKAPKSSEAMAIHAEAHLKPMTSITKSVIASKDGSELIAMGGADGAVTLWLLQPKQSTGALKDIQWSITKQKSLILHAGAITALAFTHSEESLYLYSAGVDGAIFCIEIKAENGLVLVKGVTEGSSPLYINLLRSASSNDIRLLEKKSRWVLTDDGRPFLDKFAEEQDALARAKFDSIKEKIRGPLNDLQLKLKTMLQHNSELPEMEVLDRDEFVINKEQQKTLLAQNEARANDVRRIISRQIAEMNIIRERMKREFWDTSDVKGRVLHGLLSVELLAYNIPTRKLSKVEKRQEANVQRLRQIEYQMMMLEPSKSSRAEARRTSSTYHHGDIIPPNINWMVNAGLLHPTLGRRLGEALKQPAAAAIPAAKPSGEEFDIAAPIRLVDLIYHPAMIRTRKQQRTQIQLLQAYERYLVGEYNHEFDEMVKLKETKMDEIEAKNTRIREICSELKCVENLTLFKWLPDEIADSMLSLQPSEMTKTPYETEDMRKTREAAEAAQRALEAQNQKDDVAGRALLDMMNGTLEVKKELAVTQSLVREAWMDQVPLEEMTAEQKLKLQAFEAEAAKIVEEKEKYKKSLDLELKKLKADIVDICRGFDDKLKQLSDLYLATRMSVLTQQMYMLRLGDVLLDHEHSCHEMKQLASEINRLAQEIQTLGIDQDQFEKRMESCRDEWHRAMEDDKSLEKAFSREIEEAAGVPLEHEVLRSLTELYRKRRNTDDGKDDGKKSGARRRNSTSKAMKTASSRALLNDAESSAGNEANQVVDDTNFDPFAFLDSKKKKHEFRKVLPLDPDIDRPESITLDSPIWAALNECRSRKITSENIVKQKSEAHAEAKEVYDITTYKLNVLKDKQRQLEKDLQELSDSIRLNSENLPILVKIKQGQDEASGDDVATLGEETESALLICRASVEKLNETILLHGKEQVGILNKIKNFRKNINLMEWEHAYLAMQKKNMDDHYTDLQLLRVTKNLQEIFTTGDSTEKQKQEQHLLESKLSSMAKSQHTNTVKQHKQLQTLKNTLAERLKENEQFKQQLADLQMHIQIREDIMASRRQAKTRPKAGKTSKMKAITVRRKLVDLAKAQTEEIEYMRQELDKMRRKTFPSFVQPVSQMEAPDDFFAD